MPRHKYFPKKKVKRGAKNLNLWINFHWNFCLDFFWIPIDSYECVRFRLEQLCELPSWGNFHKYFTVVIMFSLSKEADQNWLEQGDQLYWAFPFVKDSMVNATLCYTTHHPLAILSLLVPVVTAEIESLTLRWWVVCSATVPPTLAFNITSCTRGRP